MADITTTRRYSVSDVARALSMKEPSVRWWFRVRLFPEHRGHYWLTHEQYAEAVRVIEQQRRERTR